MTRYHPVAVLALALVVACRNVGGDAASTSAAAAQVPETALPARPQWQHPIAFDLSRVEITLERTECFGWCPNYKVVITGDGRVRYTGSSFVRDVGEREGRISPGQVTELLSRFEKAGFFGLADTYSQPVDCLPSQFLTLRTDGRSKRVENYWVGEGDPWAEDAPHREVHLELDSIASAIDQAVDIEQWIGSKEERMAIIRDRR